jgi:hypothetical protein
MASAFTVRRAGFSRFCRQPFPRLKEKPLHCQYAEVQLRRHGHPDYVFIYLLPCGVHANKPLLVGTTAKTNY